MNTRSQNNLEDETTATFGGRIGHALGDVRHKVARGARRMSHKSLDEISRDTKKYVQAHSGRIALASLALGFAAGVLMARSRPRNGAAPDRISKAKL